MKGFMPINEIFKMYNEGRLEIEDLIDLSPYNCCLFAYTMLDLPFSRFSPAQEYILDTFYNPENKYRELVLVCGRKSGKTTMAAVIVLYEVYKLLTLIEDPQDYYGLMPNERIYVMLVGPSKEQVQNVAFDYIKSLAKTSPYLRNFIKNETSEELLFEKNIVVRAQTSSSRSGRGPSTMMIVYDEIAHFLDTRGNLSGTEVYYALQPNLRPLAPDSKSVLISSPAGKQGIFWELFKSGDPVHVLQMAPEHGEEPWRAVFQYPTWEMNPKLKFKCLNCPHQDDPKKCSSRCPSWELYHQFKHNPERFEMEYGAMFCDVVNAALSAERILACATGRPIDFTTIDKETPRVISLDPALTGDSYALVMGHLDGDVVVVDLIKYWQGDRDHPIRIDLVESFVRQLCQKFNVTHIVLDQYQSASTVQRLRQEGLPIYMVNVTQKYNQAAYEHLISRINMEKIIYPKHRRLINELTFLQRKQTGKSVRYEAAVGYTDDLADALARLVYTLDTEGKRKVHLGW